MNDRAQTEHAPGPEPSRQAPVLSKLYDLLLWYLPVVGRFKREIRFAVGQRITDALIEAHGLLTDAAYGRRRTEALALAARLIDRARLLTRLAHDLQALDHKRYFHAAERLVEIGRMVGGWRRADGRRSGHVSSAINAD